VTRLTYGGWRGREDPATAATVLERVAIARANGLRLMSLPATVVGLACLVVGIVLAVMGT
jgi:hypothetical protein